MSSCTPRRSPRPTTRSIRRRERSRTSTWLISLQATFCESAESGRAKLQLNELTLRPLCSNAYLSDSSSPPRISRQSLEGWYVAHTASYYTNQTCKSVLFQSAPPRSTCMIADELDLSTLRPSRTLFAEKAYLPFDNASTLAFNQSAWPVSGGQTVIGGVGGLWWLTGLAGAVAAVGGGLSL